MKVVDVIRETNRPEKTVYSITDAGKEEFERLYFEQLLKKSICIDLFIFALSFTSYVDQEKVASALEKRLRKQLTYLEKMQNLYQVKKVDHSIANLSIIMRTIMHLKVELTWFTHLLEAAKSNKLTEVDDGYFEDVEKIVDEF